MGHTRLHCMTGCPQCLCQNLSAKQTELTPLLVVAAIQILLDRLEPENLQQPGCPFTPSLFLGIRART